MLIVTYSEVESTIFAIATLSLICCIVFGKAVILALTVSIVAFVMSAHKRAEKSSPSRKQSPEVERTSTIPLAMSKSINDISKVPPLRSKNRIISGTALELFSSGRTT